MDINSILKQITENSVAVNLIKDLKITKEEVIDNIPTFLDILEQDAKNGNTLVSLKRLASGNLQRVESISKFGIEKMWMDKVLTNYIVPFVYHEEEKTDYSDDRKRLISEFSSIVKNKDTKNGIYIYGPIGSGKTFLMKKFAKKLATKGYTIAFASTLEIQKKLKASFSQTNHRQVTSSEISSVFKKADYVFFDDIGSETIGSWFRDDFLFDILNFRLENKKSTFFSSNLKIIDQEKKQSLKTANSGGERIVSRIKGLTKQILILGQQNRK